MHGLRSLTLALLIGSALCAGARADAVASAGRYPIADRGRLLLPVPPGWIEQVERPAPGAAPKIFFGTRTPPAFLVTLNTALTGAPADATLRAQAAALLDAARPQARELDIELQRLHGRAGAGYYFNATDIAPAPGSFEFLTRGVLQIGPLTVEFTVLSNEQRARIVGQALDLLERAVFLERPTTPAAE